MIDACIAGLLRYAEDTGLIEADDRLWARNRLLEALQLDGCDLPVEHGAYHKIHPMRRRHIRRIFPEGKRPDIA